MVTPEHITVQLKSVIGDNLISVILFGSGATEDQTKKYSDINLLVLVKEVGLSVLKSTLPIVKSWVKAGNPAPLFFSEKRFHEAHDVFPIEFYDMKESHRILWGQDPFARMLIKNEPLRHQLEHELRSKLITLQQKYLETEGDPKRLRELLAGSLSSFQVLFKSVLRLCGKEAPAKKKDTWDALAKHVPIDVEALNVILALRQKDKTALQHGPEDLLERLMRSVKAVIDYVDSYGGGSK
jgi:predicted nucleotidyltransferase